jgi:assimilatory nitrate reductase catalytic subunit
MFTEDRVMESAIVQANVRTTCPYCGVGCGVLASADGSGGATITGDPQHPANFGRLCSKGAALGETLSLEGRLLHPMRRMTSGGYEKISWDHALEAMAEGFSHSARRHGPDSIAFYLSGQLLSEDYYVANKLMKGFLGTANVDTNSRLCMASSVAGHKRAFGGDLVPGCYDDLDKAEVIVLVGSNAAWCHPVLFQRIQANRAARGARLIVIDPRRTASADEADLYLPIAMGMDTILFAWLLQQIIACDAVDHAFVKNHTIGFEAAVQAARAIAPDLASVADMCGLPAALIQRFCDLWISTPRIVTAWSQGVNQSAQGTDKVDAIIHCHLASGRIGKEGSGPFSLTGQPNAMGGREAGGLATMLAAHMGFTPVEIDRVRRFWNAPLMAQREGLRAVEMFEAIADKRVRALWVMATNPAVSLPKADHVRQALASLDFFAISDVIMSNDTINAGAHILLPAAGWGEKDGTVTNSERRISRQRPFLPLPADVRPDWWIICELAKLLGCEEAFSYSGPAAIFREHVALSCFENNGSRGFDLGGLWGLSPEDYETLEPVQWPIMAGQHEGACRLFADGVFNTPDGRARFVDVAKPALAMSPSPDFPLLLNTGRMRDQWHTMTRTGLSPRLGSHAPEPFISVNPQDAQRLGLAHGGFSHIASPFGAAVLRVHTTDTQEQGCVFAPIHWSDETSAQGRIGALVNPAIDPYSGQPELKATPVRLAPLQFEREGGMISRQAMRLPDAFWWARVRLSAGNGYRLAFNDSLSNAARWFHEQFGSCDILELIDTPQGLYRAAAFSGEQLEAALFLSPSGTFSSWSALTHLLSAHTIPLKQRRFVLSLREAIAANNDDMVCACFGVAGDQIREAIMSGASDAAAVGMAVKAGTNCGSCVPEIRKMITEINRTTAATGR